MIELIKVSETNGNAAVSARELYNFLSVDDGSHFTSWASTNIGGLFTQNVDYQILRHDVAARLFYILCHV